MVQFLKKIQQILLICIILSFVSCGKQSPMIKDISVTPGYVQNDLYITLDTELSIGNVSLPTAVIPVFIPNTWEKIGEVKMSGLMGSKNLLSVDINLSAISNLEGKTSTLPNGMDLPLIAKNKTIEIPVSDKLILYISIGDNVAAIGVSVPFKAFDNLGSKVGTSGLFPSFYIKDVIGSAGVYTSKTAGKNGFALFADITNLLDPVDFLRLNTTTDIEVMKYEYLIPSNNIKKKIDEGLFKLHKVRKVLKLN